MAVRSLLPRSLSPFSPSSWVRLETAINTNSQLRLPPDILAHLKPCFPPRRLFFFSPPSLPPPRPFEIHIRVKMHTRRLNLRGEALSASSRSLLPLARSQHLKVVGGWRFDSSSQNFFFLVRVFSSVTHCQSISRIVRRCWRVPKKKVCEFRYGYLRDSNVIK